VNVDHVDVTVVGGILDRWRGLRNWWLGRWAWRRYAWCYRRKRVAASSNTATAWRLWCGGQVGGASINDTLLARTVLADNGLHNDLLAAEEALRKASTQGGESRDGRSDSPLAQGVEEGAARRRNGGACKLGALDDRIVLKRPSSWDIERTRRRGWTELHLLSRQLTFKRGASKYSPEAGERQSRCGQ
jgi:hypothetical protein